MACSVRDLHNSEGGLVAYTSNGDSLDGDHTGDGIDINRGTRVYERGVEVCDILNCWIVGRREWEEPFIFNLRGMLKTWLRFRVQRPLLCSHIKHIIMGCYANQRNFDLLLKTENQKSCIDIPHPTIPSGMPLCLTLRVRYDLGSLTYCGVSVKSASLVISVEIPLYPTGRPFLPIPLSRLPLQTLPQGALHTSVTCCCTVK